MKGMILFVCNDKVHIFRALIKDEPHMCNDFFVFVSEIVVMSPLNVIFW